MLNCCRRFWAKKSLPARAALVSFQTLSYFRERKKTMAENEPKPVDNVDALAAMANGADLDEPMPGEEVDSPQADDQQEQPPEAAVDFTAAAASTAPVRPAPARRFEKQGSAVYAHSYKKIMVPLLLVVGVLLVGIGIFCWVFGRTPVVDAYGMTEVYGLGKDKKFYGLISAPLGVILLIGSYVFSMELRRAQAKAKAKLQAAQAKNQQAQ